MGQKRTLITIQNAETLSDPLKEKYDKQFLSDQTHLMKNIKTRTKFNSKK